MLYRLIKENELSADLICPVPMFKADEEKRGYNQCNLIAKELSAMTGIEWSKKALLKTKETKSQKELSATERKQNLSDAFYADSEIVKGKSIILLDDVCTAGGSLYACQSLLRQAGAARVICAVVGKTGC